MGAEQFEPPPPGAGKRCCGWLEVVARLRHGISVEQARRELDGIQSSILAEHGPADVNPAVNVMPLSRYLTDGVRRAILILIAAGWGVFLVRGVHSAKLLLPRPGFRKKENMIRCAPGAPRFPVIQHFLNQKVV